MSVCRSRFLLTPSRKAFLITPAHARRLALPRGEPGIILGGILLIVTPTPITLPGMPTDFAVERGADMGGGYHKMNYAWTRVAPLDETDFDVDLAYGLPSGSCPDVGGSWEDESGIADTLIAAGLSSYEDNRGGYGFADAMCYHFRIRARKAYVNGSAPSPVSIATAWSDWVVVHKLAGH